MSNNEYVKQWVCETISAWKAAAICKVCISDNFIKMVYCNFNFVECAWLVSVNYAVIN